MIRLWNCDGCKNGSTFFESADDMIWLEDIKVLIRCLKEIDIELSDSPHNKAVRELHSSLKKLIFITMDANAVPVSQQDHRFNCTAPGDN